MPTFGDKKQLFHTATLIIIKNHKCHINFFHVRDDVLTGQPLSHTPHASHPWNISESLVPDSLEFHITLKQKTISTNLCFYK